MALKNVIGVDHAVVMARNLDKAADGWRRLGFTLSPRGTHSAHMGTGNYTIMLDPDYIELLGVLASTEHNAPARAFLDAREGIERVAFTAIDGAAGADEIRARGFTPLGPNDFERPVTMPDGRLSAAKFRTFQWPVAEAPAGMRIFACQHKTRETVWIPELMQHANGAKHLTQVLLVAPDPAKEAAHLSRLTDREARKENSGALARALGRRPCRLRIHDAGSTGAALSGCVACGPARARRGRARHRGRSGEGGKGAWCCGRSQRREHLRAACCGERHAAGVCNGLVDYATADLLPLTV